MSRYFWSATTPTTSRSRPARRDRRHREVLADRRSRRERRRERLGDDRHPGAPGTSRSSKSRPARIGVPSVAKYPGLTWLTFELPFDLVIDLDVGVPERSAERRREGLRERITPGRARRRSSRSRYAATRFSAGNARSRKNTLATTMPRSLTPVSCVARFWNVRRNSRPPKSSTSVTAICTATSTRRSLAPSLPAVPRSRADPRCRREPQRRRDAEDERGYDAAARVKPKTRQSIARSRWMRSTTVLISGGIDRLTTSATPTAAIDPSAASSTLSVNTCWRRGRASRRSRDEPRTPVAAPSRARAAGSPGSPRRSAGRARRSPSGSTAAAGTSAAAATRRRTHRRLARPSSRAPPVGAVVGHGVALHVGQDALQVRLRLRTRPSRLQPADRREPPVIAPASCRTSKSASPRRTGARPRRRRTPAASRR